MQEQKRKSGSKQAALAFLFLYAVITLAPACAYGLNRLLAKEETETVKKTASAPASPSPAESRIPGFLDSQAASLPEEQEEDVFAVYDQSTGENLHIPGRKLLPAAIACEMDLSSPAEALKAQAVACYTLFSRKRADGEILVCDSAEWQVWTTEDIMRERWGEDYEANMAILEGAVEEVYGELLQWEGEPILAVYSAISSGSTETAGNVWEGDLPYLQAVASPGDAFSDGYLSVARFSADSFREAANSYFTEDPPDLSGPEDSWLAEIEYTPSGYVSSAMLGGKKVGGQELRSAFSLRSACFQAEYTEGEFVFTVRGWGHGVGMSQAGAVFMAKRGASYRDILAHYYPGAELK